MVSEIKVYETGNFRLKDLCRHLKFNFGNKVNNFHIFPPKDQLRNQWRRSHYKPAQLQLCILVWYWKIKTRRRNPKYNWEVSKADCSNQWSIHVIMFDFKICHNFYAPRCGLTKTAYCFRVRTGHLEFQICEEK